MQTRPFVVEHKITRRRERAHTQSIWAGLDLAAVAEDVADELPAEQDNAEQRKRAVN